jgi:hypothetical protein
MNNRNASFLVGLVVTLTLASVGDATVLCQKKNRVKVRSDQCKSKETQVASIAGDVTGVWEHTGAGAGGPILTGGLGAEPRFLTFNADGSGRANLAEPATNALICGDFTFSQGSALTVDLAGLGQSPEIWLPTLQGDTLTLSGRGRASTFARAPAVTPAAECKTLVENARFTGLPRPDSFSGLAFDGSQLWYEESNTAMIFPVDPSTGMVGTPIGLTGSQFSHVHSMQGSDFWTHCGCGGSQEAQRRSMADVEIDEVATDTDLGVDVSIRAISYDAVGGRLFLHGNLRDGSGNAVLLEVSSDLEPDALVSQKRLNVSLRSFAFDGTHLWGVSGFGNQVILQIDPVTATVANTYATPDPTVQWVGIAVVGADLLLSGESGGAGVIVRVTP